jgi:hypothetical protein
MERERLRPLVAQRGAILTTSAPGQGHISKVARIHSGAAVVVVTTAAEQEPVPSILGSLVITRTTPQAEVLAAAM